MFLWPIIQMCLLILVAVIIVTQCIIPAFVGKPLFWLFRKTNSEIIDAQKVLSDLDVTEAVQHLKDQIKEKARSIKRHRH